MIKTFFAAASLHIRSFTQAIADAMLIMPLYPGDMPSQDNIDRYNKALATRMNEPQSDTSQTSSQLRPK